MHAKNLITNGPRVMLYMVWWIYCKP